MGRTGALLEPAAGRGAFLARAWARAVEVGARPRDLAARLVGVEVHPFACRAARLRLALEAARAGRAGAPLPPVHLGDALDDDPRWPAGAFDLVVGNPPYVRGERLTADRRAALRARWPDLGAGNVDLAAYFVRRALDWARPGGRLAFVLTQGVCDARAAEGLRARLAEVTLERLVGFEWAPPQFSAAAVIPCVLVARRAPPPPDHAVALGAARGAPLVVGWGRAPQGEWAALGRGRWPVEVREGDLPLLGALERAPRPLVAGYGLAIRTGRARAGALIADAGSPGAEAFVRPRPLLDGREVRAWSIDWAGRVIDYRPEAMSDPKTEAFFAGPKVVMARIALTTQAAVDDGDDGPFFARNTVMVVRAPGTPLDAAPHALCAVLNSLPLRAYAFLLLRAGALAGSHRATFYSGVINALPVPALSAARAADLAALGRAARDQSRAGDAAALRVTEAAVDAAVARAFGLGADDLEALRARAASEPLATVLRPPRARARRIAVRDFATGARYR
ncbi:MAG: N-6 DNA methylase [Planctomycetes bacterium]|nr:N-6 DNA methylase [Planctomycetota bacterium]